MDNNEKKEPEPTPEPTPAPAPKCKILKVQATCDHNTLWLEWDTSCPVPCKVVLSQEHEDLDSRETPVATHHNVVFTDLDSNSIYVYEITCQDTPESYVGQFTTTSGSAE